MANTDQQKAQQWRYCSVCRRNHDEGKKHKYSKQHKNKLEQILSKFSKKVRSARRMLTKPNVLDGELEPGAKMWCYCCEQEVDKHITDGNVSIEWGGLIEHLSNTSHHKKARHYWWVNGAEQTQLQTFLLFPVEYRRYKELVDEALKKLEEKREERLRKVAAELRVKEQLQSVLAMEPPTIPSTPQDHQRQRDSKWTSSGNTYSQPATTSSAVKPSTSTSSQPAIRGNVHTGATPPWLRDDDDEDDSAGSSVKIGPSVEEFIKHKERQRHAGKNPKRVGADFHLKLALSGQKDSEDDNWLPSFGRVWNYGPRLHSKNEFLRELETKGKRKTDRTKPAYDTSTPYVVKEKLDQSTSSADVKPYIRTRIMKNPNTVSHLPASSESQIQRSKVQSSPPVVESNTAGSGTLNTHTPSSQPATVPRIKPYVRKRSLPNSKDLYNDSKKVSNEPTCIIRESYLESSQQPESSHSANFKVDQSPGNRLGDKTFSQTFNNFSSEEVPVPIEQSGEHNVNTSTTATFQIKPYVRKRTLKSKKK